MDAEDEDGGLFNIQVDSDIDQKAQAQENKLPRDFQSEEDFNYQLKNWRPKIENGDIWKNLKLPLDNPSKPESQAILHAVEELYFLKRYEDASDVVRKALEGELIEEFRGTLGRYEKSCVAKIEKSRREANGTK